jgi:phage gp29-like protein
MPSPDRRKFTDLPVSAVGEFDTAGTIRSILREHEQGIFTRSARLSEAMGRDDRVRGVMSTRILGLLGKQLQFEPQGHASRGKTVVTDVESFWWTAFSEASLAALFRWGITLGIGVGELIWERTSGAWTPTLKVWHPQFVYWDWLTRAYWVITQDGPIQITPGDGKWILFTPGETNRGWMEGLVRAIALPWLVRLWARRDWARYSEVHGLPTRKAILPKDLDEDVEAAYMADIASLGSEPVIASKIDVNTGKAHFDYELVEATANTWDGIAKLKADADIDIAVAILGQNLTTQVDGGSFAAASAHNLVRLDICEADAEMFSTCLREQALKPWAIFNYGDAELAPYPRWQVRPPDDQQKVATNAKAWAEAAEAVQRVGLRIDVKTLLESQSTPLLADKPATKPSVQETALNGAQVTALIEVVSSVAQGQIPRGSGVATLVQAFQFTPEEAEQIMGEVGRGFVPAPPPAVKPAPSTPEDSQ